jgi:large subunit ribosomal protein L18
MNKAKQGINRQLRIRRKIRLTADRPRLSIFRSNKHLYAQIIDDKLGKTLLGVSEKLLKNPKGSKVEIAKEMGAELAKKAIELKVKSVVFDKGRFSYHGRVKAFADGAREGGLQF